MFCANRTTLPNTVALLLTLLAAGNIGAAWQPQLSDDEVALLASQAKLTHQSIQRSATKSRSQTTLGIEVLMVELEEKKSRNPSDPRLAEVFIFDYATNSASVQLIDTDTHQLINTRTIKHIHLPLNQHEQDLTYQMLLRSTELVDELESEYTAQFGQPLTSIAQLDMKVSIWQPGPADTQGSFCALTRCALVSIFTNNFYNFSIEPIVELQNAKVHLDLIQ